MSDYLIEPGSFQARVREEVLRLLRDPLSLPPEFRSWLVPFIESSNVQIPRSQIVGNDLVAESVNQLGGNIHGRVGQVRVGSDYMQVVYDGVNAQWVSNPIFVGGLASGVNNSVGSSHGDLYGSTVTNYNSPARTEITDPADHTVKVMYPVGGGFLHAPLTDAGLKAQLSYYAALSTSSNSVITSIGFSDGDYDGTVSVFNSDASFELTFTSSSRTLKTSGWLDLPSGIASSPKDAVFVQFVARASAGTPSIALSWVAIYVRYVSA